MKEQSKIYGLILAGGKSTRMGYDKGVLNYHGKAHREYLFDLASQFCQKVCYSIREEQQQDFNGKPVIVDQDEFRGPFNGIFSAHNKYKGVAWLVLACDLPLLDAEHIEQLIVSRNLNCDTIAFATRKTGLPEPLVAIWEPAAIKKAIVHMRTNENSGPRKFLLNSSVELVYPRKDEILYNANTLEEFKQAKSIIGS